MHQAYRGQLWKCFLNIDKKAQEGVYDRLVSKALGISFKGKVRPYTSASQTLCSVDFICKLSMSHCYTGALGHWSATFLLVPLTILGLRNDNVADLQPRCLVHSVWFQ